MNLRVIQPPTWAGLQKGGPDSPMVCGACPDWEACDSLDRCARASDEDYTRGGVFTMFLDHDSHSWMHRCFPPQPSICTFCGAESGSQRASQPCTLEGP